MDEKTAALSIMAKMALCDGNVDAAERSMLADLVGGDAEVDAVLEIAKTTTLEELVAKVESYADRFFVALRAYFVAHADDDFDVKEQALFARIVEHMKLTDGDLELIRSTEAAMRSAEAPAPDPRFEELYKQSSFAKL